MPDARHSLLSQWSRKMGSQQSGGSEDMATILGNLVAPATHGYPRA